jgi:hypothetical protein
MMEHTCTASYAGGVSRRIAAQAGTSKNVKTLFKK